MDSRHMKRHSRKDTLVVGHERFGPAVRPSVPSEATTADGPSVDGSLTTVKEEENVDDDQLGASNSAMTFALTSKHLLATSNVRSSYHGTKDLNSYQTLCQQKSLSHVPSPYHAVESVRVQNVKAASKTSEVDSEDTGYKSGNSSFASHEMQVRHRKSTEVPSSKHKERVNAYQRIQTQNPRPPTDPITLAALLIEKLEEVRRSQDSADGNHYRSREDLEKEDAQSILDDHISRVFGDSSGELSPREKVSSWFMDTKKYCDMRMEDSNVDDKEKMFKGFAPMDTSESTHHSRRPRRLDASNRIGSIDEGLGKSISSLATSSSGVEQTRSLLSATDDVGLTRSANGVQRRNLLQSKSHDPSKPFSNLPLCKSTKKVPSSALLAMSSSMVPSSTPREMISVVYQIVGEALPYLSKVPGTQLTLRQLKAVVPRKGKYRYFLKRKCAELDAGAVFEEITDDNETLPFWEGKISARLESVE